MERIVARDPELAVVVMSFRNATTVIEAVDSVLVQDVPVELVVSHSSGGPTEELLARERPEVRVVASTARRFPGGARNAGVAATSAPVVAFLAADCLALPGWAEGRLAHHRRGAAGVASALVPTHARSASLAAHLLQHSNRLAGFHPAPAQRFGVSYLRSALTRAGPFREEEGYPEDVAMNEELVAAGDEIIWAPEVLTAHRYPTTLRALAVDQHRRGRVHGALHQATAIRLLLAARTPVEAVVGLHRARVSGLPIRRLVRALPHLAVAVAASSAGRLRGGGPVHPRARAYMRRRLRRRFARPSGPTGS